MPTRHQQLVHRRVEQLLATGADQTVTVDRLTQQCGQRGLAVTQCNDGVPVLIDVAGLVVVDVQGVDQQPGPVRVTVKPADHRSQLILGHGPKSQHDQHGGRLLLVLADPAALVGCARHAGNDMAQFGLQGHALLDQPLGHERLQVGTGGVVDQRINRPPRLVPVRQMG